MWNPDTTGVTRSKPSPRLATANLDQYQVCVQWVKSIMQSVGYTIVEARLDPYCETWYFYEEDGWLVMRLQHDTMDEMWMKLTQPYGENHKD